MFFPLMDYITIDRSVDAGETTSFLTLTYKAWVVPELTRGEANSFNELIRVYADNTQITSFTNDIDLLVCTGGLNLPTYTASRLHIMPAILQSGARIRLQSIAEDNVDATLHVFRLPDNV